MSRPSKQGRSSPRTPWLLLVVALASGGCVASPAVHAASLGRYEGLRASLQADFVAGKLDLGEAVDFARAVAKGEIAHAKGEQGVQRIRELRSCANEIYGALGDRAEVEDAVGAEAAMALVDSGVQSPGHYARWALTPPGGEGAAFRPLGARSLVSVDDGALRRRLMADPDEEVRRNAMRAASVAADPADTDTLLEAARVDPSPAAREQAIRALGALGGERVVLALKDLWPRADVSARGAIVDAWRRERCFAAGGSRELGWVVSAERGPAAILAAAYLTRAGGAGAGEAAGVLERAIKDGPSEDRVRAVEVAPLGIASLREAVRAAEGDPDEAVAAAAMVRRLEASAANGGAREGSPERAALVAKLLLVAAGTGPGAVAARGGLARARVRPLVGILEREAEAKDPKRRAEAGTGLAVLGEVARAAPFAADLEPSVRTTVACAILRDWTRR